MSENMRDLRDILPSNEYLVMLDAKADREFKMRDYENARMHLERFAKNPDSNFEHVTTADFTAEIAVPIGRSINYIAETLVPGTDITDRFFPAEPKLRLLVTKLPELYRVFCSVQTEEKGANSDFKPLMGVSIPLDMIEADSSTMNGWLHPFGARINAFPYDTNHETAGPEQQVAYLSTLRNFVSHFNAALPSIELPDNKSE
jgi:hypothetical protein